jgi:predicted DsbA family dithiol-disulfide isomerase
VGRYPFGVERFHLLLHAGLSRRSKRKLEAGLAYDFDIQQPANTTKAHELLQLAKARRLQPQLKERLLRAHFVEGGHVGRDADLADLAAEVGLDRSEALQALQQHTYLAAVHDDIRRAGQLGVSGVPFFVIDHRYGISGAHGSETFVDALTRVRRDRRDASAA